MLDLAYPLASSRSPLRLRPRPPTWCITGAAAGVRGDGGLGEAAAAPARQCGSSTAATVPLPEGEQPRCMRVVWSTIGLEFRRASSARPSSRTGPALAASAHLHTACQATVWPPPKGGTQRVPPYDRHAGTSVPLVPAWQLLIHAGFGPRGGLSCPPSPAHHHYCELARTSTFLLLSLRLRPRLHQYFVPSNPSLPPKQLRARHRHANAVHAAHRPTRRRLGRTLPSTAAPAAAAGRGARLSACPRLRQPGDRQRGFQRPSQRSKPRPRLAMGRRGHCGQWRRRQRRQAHPRYRPPALRAPACRSSPEWCVWGTGEGSWGAMLSQVSCWVKTLDLSHITGTKGSG